MCSSYNQGICKGGPGCMFDHTDMYDSYKSSSYISWILLLRQCYSPKKGRKLKKNVKFFVFFQETCFLFVQSPLRIKKCQILMIFYYFSWKWRRSPSPDLANKTFWRVFSSNMSEQIQTLLGLNFLWPNILLSCW